MVRDTDFIFFNYVLLERRIDSSSVHEILGSEKVNWLVKAFFYYLTTIVSCIDKISQHVLLYLQDYH